MLRRGKRAALADVRLEVLQLACAARFFASSGELLDASPSARLIL